MENNIDLNIIPEIPHGHGLSFKKGVSDSLLGNESPREDIHETHRATYQKGLSFGLTLKQSIGQKVK